MGHPDFRVNSTIFASLQSAERAMVKLTPEQQSRFVADYPDAFAPESGAWGRQGYTRVYLTHVDEETAGEALTLAWQNVAAGTRRGTPARRRSRR